MGKCVTCNQHPLARSFLRIVSDIACTTRVRHVAKRGRKEWLAPLRGFDLDSNGV
jgi:hypothetical protein